MDSYFIQWIVIFLSLFILMFPRPSGTLLFFFLISNFFQVFCNEYISLLYMGKEKLLFKIGINGSYANRLEAWKFLGLSNKIFDF